MNKLQVTADVPQLLINVFNILNYGKFSESDLTFFIDVMKGLLTGEASGEVKLLIEAAKTQGMPFANLHKKTMYKRIFIGDYGTEQLGKQKLASDLPQRLLNVLSSVDFSKLTKENATGLANNLYGYIMQNAGTFPLKPNAKKYLEVR